jgi:hypothetical protein
MFRDSSHRIIIISYGWFPTPYFFWSVVVVGCDNNTAQTPVSLLFLKHIAVGQSIFTTTTITSRSRLNPLPSSAVTDSHCNRYWNETEGMRRIDSKPMMIPTSTPKNIISPLRILACSASSFSSEDQEAESSLSNGFPTSLEEFQSALLAATRSPLDNNYDTSNDNKINPREEISDGPLCEFRRGFLDHLKPNALVKSVSH